MHARGRSADVGSVTSVAGIASGCSGARLSSMAGIASGRVRAWMVVTQSVGGACGCVSYVYITLDLGPETAGPSNVASTFFCEHSLVLILG